MLPLQALVMGSSLVDWAREIRDRAIIQEVTVSSLKDKVNRAQQTVRDFEKKVVELVIDKEHSDAA